MQDFSRIREALNHSKAEFLKTDLDTALTFAEIAFGASNDTDKRKRNQDHARQAYDTVLRFLNHVVLNAQEDRDIQDRLSRLKLALKDLGEVF